MPFTILDAGSFVSDGTAKKINVPSSCDKFVTYNVTQMAAANPNTVIQGIYFGPKFGLAQSPAGQGIKVVKTTADLTGVFAAGTGFTYVQSSPVVEAQAAAAITSISQADPAVVAQVNSYNEGDFIRIYGTTGMLQIAGMVFQISTVTGAGYELIGLDASGFAAAATAGYTRRVSKYEAVDPQFLFVTAISQATQAVVRCSVDPSQYYVVGNKIHFNIPLSFGMQQMNQLTGVILDIDDSTYEITVDIDSSAFDAFAFPASADSPTAGLFATLSPAGSKTSYDPATGLYTGYEFVKSPFHSGQFVPYMYLAGGAQSPAGANLDKIIWECYKYET